MCGATCPALTPGTLAVNAMSEPPRGARDHLTVRLTRSWRREGLVVPTFGDRD